MDSPTTVDADSAHPYKRVVTAAEQVFDELGSGHTESVYHRALETELSARGIQFTSETTLPIRYRGNAVGRCHPDLVVRDNDEVAIVELKAGSSRGEDQLSGYCDRAVETEKFESPVGLLLQFRDSLYTHVDERYYTN
jgi:GxxExxY protein